MDSVLVRWIGESFYELQRKPIGVQLQKAEAFAVHWEGGIYVGESIGEIYGIYGESMGNL